MSPCSATIGIIGGLGPLAGANLYRRLVEATDVPSDQDHPGVVLISDPAVPSRLDHLEGSGPSPAPDLAGVARRLQVAGADLVVISSITTHAYFTDIAGAVTVPVLDGRVETAAALRRAAITRPAVLATTSARRLGLLEPALRAAGITPRYPDGASQDEIQQAVELVKAGRSLQEVGAAVGALLRRGWPAGADGVLVGCTDLSPLGPYLGAPVHDVADILARAALARVGSGRTDPIGAGPVGRLVP